MAALLHSFQSFVLAARWKIIDTLLTTASFGLNWISALALTVVIALTAAIGTAESATGTLLFQAQRIADGQVLELPGGVIRVERAIRIIGRSNVTIRGNTKQKTEIRGSRIYQTRHLKPNEPLPAGLIASNLLVIDADDAIRELWSIGGEAAIGCNATSDVSLFQDDHRFVCARWPKHGYARSTAVIIGDKNAFSFPVPPEQFASWQRLENLTVSGYFAVDWYYESANAAFDPTSGVVRTSLQQSYKPQKNFRYVMAGAPAYLTDPGEYISDPVGNRIFLTPLASGTDTPQIEIPIAQNIFDVQGGANITIENINISRARGTGIAIANTRKALVRDVQLSHLNDEAVSVRGGEGVVVDQVVVDDIGGTGVLLDGGDRRRLHPAGHSVRNSVIQKTSQIRRTYHPAIWLNGVGNSALGNFIADLPHMAIGFAGNDHIIAGNEITRVVTETSDSGAVYAGRDWTWRGTKIEGNYFHDILPEYEPSLADPKKDIEIKGIYLDDMLSGTEVRNNVFSRVQKPIFVGGGRDNLVEGNLVISPLDPAMLLDDRGLNSSDANNPDSTIRKRLNAVPVANEYYVHRYPELARILDDNAGAPLRNRFLDNIVVGGAVLKLNGSASKYAITSGNMEISNWRGNITDLRDLISTLPDNLVDLANRPTYVRLKNALAGFASQRVKLRTLMQTRGLQNTDPWSAPH